MSNYIPYKNIPNYRTVDCCKWCKYNTTNRCNLYSHDVEDYKICDRYEEE